MNEIHQRAPRRGARPGFGLAAIPALALAACALAPGRARAQAEVVVVGDPQAQQNTQQIIGNQNSNTTAINNALRQVEIDVIDALRLHSGQRTADSKAELRAAGNIADTQDAREVQRRIEDAKLRALNSTSSGASTCNVVTGAIGGQNIEQAVSIWREQVIQAQLDFDAGGPNSPSRNGGRAGLEGAMAAHCKNNATQLDVDQGTCASVTQKTTAVGALAGLPVPSVGSDLNANTILGAPNHVMSRDDTVAAAQFLGLAIVGAPLGKLSKAEAQTEEGRRRVQERMIAVARNSVASAVVGGIVADRQPFESSVVGQGGASTGVKDWAEGTAKQVLGYKAEGGNFPDGVSRRAWMDLGAKRWFMNPTWAVKVDSQNVDQTAKDLAMIAAFTSYQLNELDRKTEQTNFLLAQIVSILNAARRDRL